MIPRAHKHLERFKGRIIYTFSVQISQSSIDDIVGQRVILKVIALNADDAVNFVRDEIAAHVKQPTEIETRGPSGGITHRFIGWESMIAAQMSVELERRNRKAKQLLLKTYGEIEHGLIDNED